MRITRCLSGCLLNNIDLTCGQHSVYLCHRSNIPWLHHTNCIKVYEANRCTFRLLKTILGKINCLKSLGASGLVHPKATLYGICREWHTSYSAGLALSLGDAMPMGGESPHTSLHRSARALLHARRAHPTAAATPYVNQARAACLWGMSELGRALHFSDYRTRI